MYQYRVDNLTIGSHEDSVFKAGRAIVAKLTLPVSMPLFWNSRISVFKEGGLIPYNLGSEVGTLHLIPEPGFSDGHIQLASQPTISIASLQFALFNNGESIPWIRNSDSIIPQIPTPIEEYIITLRLCDIHNDVEDQRIILRIQGECTSEGLHTHTAWAIILLRKQSLGGITLKWIII